MNFRFQEIIRYIVPGFYLSIKIICAILIFNLQDILNNVFNEIDYKVIYLSLFIISYVIGFIIEAIISYIEYYLYCTNILIKRPSYMLLKDISKRYKISDLDKLKNRLNNPTISSNSEAKKVFDGVKQSIKFEYYNDEMYYQMVMARNIFGSQLLGFVVLIILLFFNFYIASLGFLVVDMILTLLLANRWYQKSMVYTKYVFIQYLNDSDN